MVNANITPYEREHDVNRQYSCETKGCENPKYTQKHCSTHMVTD